MSSSFFVSGARHAEKVNQLFTTIAPRYDLINDLQSFGLHRYWKWRSIRLIAVQPGECALDVCCGTGDLAVALARHGARTVGLDFNRDMLRIAESRKSKMRFPTSFDDSSDKAALASPDGALRFLQGDAQALPFPDNSFDIVTIGYGLRNLTSWETGLAEMQRICKPGGRLLILEFGKPENPIWRNLYFSYLRVFVPVLGRIFCGNSAAYGYILESLKHYPGSRQVAAVMREFGLAQIRIINLLGGIMSIHFARKIS